MSKVIVVMVGLLLGGCVNLDLDLSDIISEMQFVPGISIHRLYKKEDLMFNENLLGTWTEKNNAKLIFEKAEETNAYILTIADVDMHDTFIAYLVKIDEMLFLDISPDSPSLDSITLKQKFYIPGHMFMKIEQIDTSLNTQLVTFWSLIEENPDILKHEVVGESDILVTASTEELQEFLKQYCQNENLFDSQPELIKKQKVGEPL